MCKRWGSRNFIYKRCTAVCILYLWSFANTMSQISEFCNKLTHTHLCACACLLQTWMQQSQSAEKVKYLSLAESSFLNKLLNRLVINVGVRARSRSTEHYRLAYNPPRHVRISLARHVRLHRAGDCHTALPRLQQRRGKILPEVTRVDTFCYYIYRCSEPVHSLIHGRPSQGCLSCTKYWKT